MSTPSRIPQASSARRLQSVRYANDPKRKPRIGREPWKIVIPMAACVVLLIYVVFDQLLAIPWPPTLAGMLFPALKVIPSV